MKKILWLFAIAFAAAAYFLLPASCPEPARRTAAIFVIAAPFSANIGGMSTPIATPPNAIAYGSGLITNQEMMRAGTAITALSFLAILVGFWWIIPLFVY